MDFGDVVFVGASLLFFGVAIGYVAVCQRLLGGGR